MTRDLRLANEAWEAMFRAQVLLLRSFAADDIWTELAQNEYDVLYTISKSADGLSMVEINRDILMSQGGISRLVGRLEARGLLERCVDPRDGRAARLVLTEEGRRLQRVVGRLHADAVATAMSRTLTHDQLTHLRELCRQITDRIAVGDDYDPLDHVHTRTQKEPA